MEIKFVSDDVWFASDATYVFLHPYDEIGICKNGLNNYFDLSDHPQEITFTISKRKHANSYFVKSIIGEVLELQITLSSGEVVTEHVFSGIFKLIAKYPEGCYVSVN